MDANDRQNEILSLLTQQDRVEVEDLARRFGVSLQTVRTDLRDLSARGQLSRVHGGAVRISSAANRGYAERRSLNASGKRAMAALASDVIPENCSIALQYRHLDRTGGACSFRSQGPDGPLQQYQHYQYDDGYGGA